jgi:hypothetical protein
MPPARQGRCPTVPADVVERIRAEHDAGTSLGEIARRLTADGLPTAHGGRRWWPSTVRAVLLPAADRSATDPKVAPSVDGALVHE